jgi:prolyl-tRNA editing enzyme YbaK/EbsC (Cys-tRNA(Pro) deacylase)
MSERKDGPGRFQKAARALGLEVELKEFAESTRTAEEAAAACGCEVAQIVKSLVFKGKRSGAPCLLLVSGANRVDQKGVAAIIGEPLDRPDGQFVRDLTGFAIGGIPPFGHDTPLRTYMDEDLMQYERIWAAAGSPNAVFPTEPKALRAAAKAEVIRVK